MNVPWMALTFASPPLQLYTVKHILMEHLPGLVGVAMKETEATLGFVEPVLWQRQTSNKPLQVVWLRAKKGGCCGLWGVERNLIFRE